MARNLNPLSPSLRQWWNSGYGKTCTQCTYSTAYKTHSMSSAKYSWERLDHRLPLLKNPEISSQLLLHTSHCFLRYRTPIFAGGKRFLRIFRFWGFTEINVSLGRIRIRLRSRRPGIRLPQFPIDDIDRIWVLCWTYKTWHYDDTNEKLRAMRDRAFLWRLRILAYVTWSCSATRRCGLEWTSCAHRGKGNVQAVVRLRVVHSMRSRISFTSCRPRRHIWSPLPSLPIFARHDKGAGKKVKPITPQQDRNIVAERVEES